MKRVTNTVLLSTDYSCVDFIGYLTKKGFRKRKMELELKVVEEEYECGKSL